MNKLKIKLALREEIIKATKKFEKDGGIVRRIEKLAYANNPQKIGLVNRMGEQQRYKKET